MRKSRNPESPVQGNAAKYLSYREAWARIKGAQRKGYYLEAVTLEESIISDRLIRYLTAVRPPDADAEPNRYPGLAQLIKQWVKHHPEPIVAGEILDLQTAVDEWRAERNNIVHGMVKTKTGMATEDIDDFLDAAAEAAATGAQLAKAVSHWCSKAVRSVSPERATRVPRKRKPKDSFPGVAADEKPSPAQALLAELGFAAPHHVEGRTSVADLFRPGKRCGIYVLHFTTGELYAGQAVDVTRRYVGHRRAHVDIRQISFKEVDQPDLNAEEQHVIEVLEQSDKLLRNVMFTSLPKGESDFDLVMPATEQERWITDIEYVEESGPRMVDPNLRRKYAKQYEKFAELPFADEVTSTLRAYVHAGIPAYRRGEASFWGITCLASNVIARVNIFWQEVLSVQQYEGQFLLSIYMAKSPFDALSDEALDRYSEQFSTLGRSDRRYRPGGPDQIHMEIGIEEAEGFLSDPVVLQAVRLFNLRLMKKGPCVYGRYHCMDLADRLVE